LYYECVFFLTRERAAGVLRDHREQHQPCRSLYFPRQQRERATHHLRRKKNARVEASRTGLFFFFRYDDPQSEDSSVCPSAERRKKTSGNHFRPALCLPSLVKKGNHVADLTTCKAKSPVTGRERRTARQGTQARPVGLERARRVLWNGKKGKEKKKRALAGNMWQARRRRPTSGPCCFYRVR